MNPSNMVKKKTKIRNVAQWIGAGLLLFGGFRYIRYQADGLRNAADPQYWKDRATGEDEYVPRFAYFKRGARDRKEVCLTLDDGPHGQCTLDELAALRTAGVKATFFVVGKKMRQYPELIRQMVADGMEVGNHTETHPELDKLPLDKVRAEVEACEHDFEKITGRRMNLFRPPHMRENPKILGLVKSMGYQTVGWNTAAHDFMPSRKDPGVTEAYINSLRATADQISDRVTANVKNGSIILLHDQPITAQALPKILATLQQDGYTFVTCREALSHVEHPIEIEADPLLTTVHVATHTPGPTAPSSGRL